MYQKIVAMIQDSGPFSFEEMSQRLEQQIHSGSKAEFLELLREIGTIPERIPHDSTEEKLFSKASDAALSRAFREIGLKSAVLRERGDSADVMAESPVHGYALVADAKAFRLSRTAKNQKDFKVAALSGWKKGADYAVLCAPYFQYPSKSSQIYAQALDYQVALLSWEHFIFLIERNVRESETLDFSKLWNFPDAYSHAIFYSDRKQCLLPPFNRALEAFAGAEPLRFSAALERRVAQLQRRAEREVDFWNGEIRKIQAYSREEAIRELISSKKIHQKITQINAWRRRLQSEWMS